MHPAYRDGRYDGPRMKSGIQAVVSTLIVVILPPSAVFGQSRPGTPISTTVCELVKTPERFNSQLVTLHGPIQIAFEDFSLSASECIERKIDSIWLEYGRGPKRQPTIWCCGDMVPRDPLALVQDNEFRRFHRYITTEKKTKGCYDCYLYHVTATLTGRFDAVETEPCPGDASSRCCGVGGFGHFGMACGRLVIQAVSEVEAKPVDPAAYDRRK